MNCILSALGVASFRRVTDSIFAFPLSHLVSECLNVQDVHRIRGSPPPLLQGFVLCTDDMGAPNNKNLSRCYPLNPSNPPMQYLIIILVTLILGNSGPKSIDKSRFIMSQYLRCKMRS